MGIGECRHGAPGNRVVILHAGKWIAADIPPNGIETRNGRAGTRSLGSSKVFARLYKDIGHGLPGTSRAGTWVEVLHVAQSLGGALSPYGIDAGRGRRTGAGSAGASSRVTFCSEGVAHGLPGTASACTWVIVLRAVQEGAVIPPDGVDARRNRTGAGGSRNCSASPLRVKAVSHGLPGAAGSCARVVVLHAAQVSGASASNSIEADSDGARTGSTGSSQPVSRGVQ
jgi:hypothetical protein